MEKKQANGCTTSAPNSSSKGLYRSKKPPDNGGLFSLVVWYNRGIRLPGRFFKNLLKGMRSESEQKLLFN